MEQDAYLFEWIKGQHQWEKCVNLKEDFVEK